MIGEATSGDWRAVRPHRLWITNGAVEMEVKREDIDDLFEVFRLLADGGVPENQSFRLDRTANGGIKLYARGAGVWKLSLQAGGAEASDLCEVIEAIMP